MSRRPVNPNRRLVDSGNLLFGGSLHLKSRSTSLLSLVLVLLGAILLIAYSYSNPGRTRGTGTVSKFEGYPGRHRDKVAELSKVGRPTNLEENEAAAKKFDQASAKQSYKPACQVFHLKPY